MGSGASQEGAMEEELEDMDDPAEEEAKRKMSEKDFRKVCNVLACFLRALPNVLIASGAPEKQRFRGVPWREEER